MAEGGGGGVPFALTVTGPLVGAAKVRGFLPGWDAADLSSHIGSELVRLGRQPLPPFEVCPDADAPAYAQGRTLAALGIADGGTVYLKPMGAPAVPPAGAQRRAKFMQPTTSSTAGRSNPPPACFAALPGLLFYIDGPLFAQGQAKSTLHFCVRADECGECLVAKVFSSDPDAVVAAEREILAGGRVPTCATIIRYVFAGTLPDSRHVIIMPHYLMSVADVIKWFLEKSRPVPGVPLPDRLVALVGLGLASALSKLHANDIAHCDVKPSNVMVRANGIPVLIDLGAVTPFGSKPVEVSKAWIAAEDTHRRDELAAVASAALDMHTLAATVYSCVIGNASTQVIVHLPQALGAVAADAAVAWRVAAACWQHRDQSAAALVEHLQGIVTGVLSPDEIAACLA